MTSPTYNPSHYNAIFDYCQDSELFYTLPNESDIVIFGNPNHYGTSIGPEIIYFYVILFTLFVFGRLHDNSRILVIVQYSGQTDYLNEQFEIEHYAFISLTGNVAFILHG